MVSNALDHAPDDGLFIVAVHAPLFNPWKEEYPYFLRQTQALPSRDRPRRSSPGMTRLSGLCQ